MTLNELFFGDNSVVDIATSETVDEIKLKLATKYQVTRRNPKGFFPEEHDDFSAAYVYYIKKGCIRIFFAKDLNRKVRHSFQVAYPWFTGEIIDTGDSRIIKGKIGLPEWTFYFTLLWLAFFGFICYIAWTNGETEGIEIPLCFILFGLITFLIGLVRTRNKVDEMRDELDRVFSNAR